MCAPFEGGGQQPVLVGIFASIAVILRLFRAIGVILGGADESFLDYF